MKLCLSRSKYFKADWFKNQNRQKRKLDHEVLSIVVARKPAPGHGLGRHLPAGQTSPSIAATCNIRSTVWKYARLVGQGFCLVQYKREEVKTERGKEKNRTLGENTNMHYVLKRH